MNPALSWVMSDWGATHHNSALMNGLDQEMPASLAKHLASDTVKSELTAGNVTQAKIDESVTRILTAMLSVGAMDRPANATGDAKTNVTSAEHNALARKLAAAGIVLLKNGGDKAAPLPLTPAVKKLAIFGGQAKHSTVGGGGSGEVAPAYIVSPMEAIRAKLAFPVGPSPTPDCSPSGYCISYTPPTASPAEIAAAVAAADVAMVFGATTSCEGIDRYDLTLANGGHSPDKGQDELFATVAEAAIAAGKPSIGVTVSPGALRTPWAANLTALISSFMPGQEYILHGT